MLWYQVSAARPLHKLTFVIILMIAFPLQESPMESPLQDCPMEC